MRLFDLFKRRGRGDDPRLHGRWLLVRTEDPEMDIGEGVEMEFSADGTLTYTTMKGDRQQIMNLTYEVNGSEIISDQPSAPARHRTRYDVDDAGQLVLEFAGAKTWFRRASGDAE